MISRSCSAVFHEGWGKGEAEGILAAKCPERASHVPHINNRPLKTSGQSVICQMANGKWGTMAQVAPDAGRSGRRAPNGSERAR
jgi:hypothetical protein